MRRTPKGPRLHIAVFGRRKVGESSMVNALSAQDGAIVSEVEGKRRPFPWENPWSFYLRDQSYLLIPQVMTMWFTG